MIAAALSIQDPRERPPTSSRPADQQHARFADEESDFLAFLNLWRYLRSSRRSCPSSQFRRMCQAEFLNYLRVREWQDIYSQLRQVAKHARHARSNERRPADAAADPHRRCWPACSPTSALEGRRRASDEYLGARERQVRDLPRLGAVQEAAALGDGGRAGRDLPAVGAGQRARSSPSGSSRSPSTWSSAATASRTGRRSRRAVMAYEKVTLYGVPIVAAAQGQLRPDRPGAVAASCSSGTPWSRATGDTHHAVLRTTTASCSTRSRSWSTGPGAATSWSTTRRCSTSTTSASPPTSSPAAHFDSWWKKARRDAARPARPSSSRC